MRSAVAIVFALVITGGLVYGCYWVWMLSGQQIKGTLIASFKFLPGVIAIFIFLSLAELLIGWVDRAVIARSASAGAHGNGEPSHGK